MNQLNQKSTSKSLRGDFRNLRLQTLFATIASSWQLKEKGVSISKTLFFLFLFLFVIGCAHLKKETKQELKPNVLIILADDLGYGDISCYGQKNYRTPNIDNIAEQGVLCTDFYVPTPYCAPSRETILTGRFPLRHGLIRNPTPDAGINDIGIGPNEITLGDVFQQAGYKTKCIGKWHLGHKPEFFPVNHGFDEYYGILYSNDMRPVQIVENRDTVEYPVDQSLLTQKYTKKALDFITKNKDNPFFLYLCHAMPHKPLAASKNFYTPETPDDLYTDVLHELDWSVGQVMKKLRDLNLLENTIVIFMSDNGPYYGGSTGGLKGMKATTWEGGIRVPFMIRYPKVFPENIKVDVPCWSPDIFSTLLALTNVKPAKTNRLDGEDITEILKGIKKTHPPVFSMHNDKIMSVRKGDYKLFIREPRYRVPNSKTWVDKRAPDGVTIIAPYEQATPAQYPGVIPGKPESRIQLFNLREDLTEDNNLAHEKPELLKEMMQDYKEFEASLKPLK
ncbi:MAG: sulfatase-like hydrolase/transferase [Prolixibacteraceae bacterium]|nr:sulfatase-like hydrolase/transferase [Prolixibacteraceae bacterium]